MNVFHDNYIVDEQFERFLDIFNTTLNKHASLRKPRKEKKLNNKPWMTKEILISSKTYCNKLTRVKEQAKRKYYQGLLLTSTHNMKFLWKTINDITKYNKKAIGLITELTCDTKEKITDRKKWQIC